MTTPIKCSACNGSGNVNCDKCDGTGRNENVLCFGGSEDITGGIKVFFGDNPYECDECHGSGEIPCSRCGGSGKIESLESKTPLP